MRNNLGTFLKYMGYIAILVGIGVTIYLEWMLVDWEIPAPFMWGYMSFIGGLILIGIAYLINHGFGKPKATTLVKSKAPTQQEDGKENEPIKEVKIQSDKKEKKAQEPSMVYPIELTRKERQELERKKGRKKKKVQPSKKEPDLKAVKGGLNSSGDHADELDKQSEGDIQIDNDREVSLSTYLKLSRHSQKYYKRKPQNIKATNQKNYYYIILKPKKVKLVKVVNDVVVEVNH